MLYQANYGFRSSVSNRKRSSEASDTQELANGLQIGSMFYLIGISMGSVFFNVDLDPLFYFHGRANKTTLLSRFKGSKSLLLSKDPLGSSVFRLVLRFEGNRKRNHKKSSEKIAMASKLVIIIVFILDLIAVGLAIAAEQRRSVGKVVPDKEKVYEYCEYGSDIATSYGAGAFVLLLTSQVIIMVASRCFCCGKALNPGGSRACAIMLFLVCWVFFLIAEICLLAGSIRNAYHTKYTRMWNIDNPVSCEVIRKGVFAAGASFALFTAIVSQFYYVSYSRARDDYKNPPY